MAHHVPPSSTRIVLSTLSVPLHKVCRPYSKPSITPLSLHSARHHVTSRFQNTRQFLRPLDRTVIHTNGLAASSNTSFLQNPVYSLLQPARTFASSPLSLRTGPLKRKNRTGKMQDVESSTADIFIDQFVKPSPKASASASSRPRSQSQGVTFGQFSGNPFHARTMVMNMDISGLPAYLNTLPSKQEVDRKLEEARKLKSFFEGMIRAMESLTGAHAHDAASITPLPPSWTPFICSQVLATFARYRHLCPQLQAYTISALLQPLLQEYSITGNGHRLLSASECVFDLGFVSPELLTTLETNMEKSFAEGTLYALRPKTIKAYVQLLDRGVSLPVLASALIRALEEACESPDPAANANVTSPSTHFLADLWWQRWRDMSIVSTPNMAPSIGSQLVLSAPPDKIISLRKCLPIFYERTIALAHLSFCGIDSTTPLSARATLFALRSLLDLAVLSPEEAATGDTTSRGLVTTNDTLDKEYLASILPLLTRLHTHLETLYKDLSPKTLEKLFLSCMPNSHATIDTTAAPPALQLWSYSPRYPVAPLSKHSSSSQHNAKTTGTATQNNNRSYFTVSFDHMHLLSVLLVTVHERTKLFSALLANNPDTEGTAKALRTLQLPTPLVHLAQQVIQGPEAAPSSLSSPSSSPFHSSMDASTSYTSSVQGVVAWRLRHLLQHLPTATRCSTKGIHANIASQKHSQPPLSRSVIQQVLRSTPSQREEHAVGSWLLDIAYPSLQFGVEIDGMAHFRPPTLKNISSAMQRLAQQLTPSNSQQQSHAQQQQQQQQNADPLDAKVAHNAHKSNRGNAPSSPLIHWSLTEASNLGPAVGQFAQAPTSARPHSQPSNTAHSNSTGTGATTTPPSTSSTLLNLAWGLRFDEIKQSFRRGALRNEYNTRTLTRARDLSLRGWSLCHIPSPVLPRQLRTRYSNGLGASVPAGVAALLTPQVLRDSLAEAKENSRLRRGGGGSDSENGHNIGSEGGSIPLVISPLASASAQHLDAVEDVPAEYCDAVDSDAPLDLLLSPAETRVPTAIAKMCVELDTFLTKEVLPSLIEELEPRRE